MCLSTCSFLLLKFRITRYGKGTIEVKIEVQQDDGPILHFILRLDTEKMPHSSHHFLQMVEKQLWKGLPLIQSLEQSLLVASPSIFDGNHHWGLGRFEEANLTNLAFQEYSTPEETIKYSVAFTGERPVGPVFVIHMLEDTKGGDEDESYGATFGSVVKGHGVLKKIMQSHQESYWEMKNMQVLVQ